MMNEQKYFLYVIHFHTPFGHAKHYTGIAIDPLARFREHVNGTGSRLMAAASAAGIEFTFCIVKCFPSYSEAHAYEKHLKVKYKKPSRWCPACRKDFYRT